MYYCYVKKRRSKILVVLFGFALTFFFAAFLIARTWNEIMGEEWDIDMDLED